MTALPAANYFNDNARTEGEIKQWGEDIRSVIDELVGGSAEADLTISSGAVVPTGATHRIDTEASASSDDLDTLTATNTPSGRLVLIRAKNSARTVVVKHNASPGAGQISLADGADFSIDDAKKAILLFNNGNYWEEIDRFWGGDKAALREWLGLKIGEDVQAYDADTAKLDVAQAWTKGQAHTHVNEASSSNAIAWDCQDGNVFVVDDLDENTTIGLPSNPADGVYLFIIQQGSTGGTVSWNAGYDFPGGSAPTASSGAGKVDHFQITIWTDDSSTKMYDVDAATAYS